MRHTKRLAATSPFIFNDFYLVAKDSKEDISSSSSTVEAGGGGGGGVDGVILLNSPSLGQWERDCYEALTSHPQCQVVVCADGAIRWILEEFSTRKEEKPNLASEKTTRSLKFPTFVCGDLDSAKGLDWVKKPNGSPSSSSSSNINPNPNPPGCRVKPVRVDTVPDLSTEDLEEALGLANGHGSSSSGGRGVDPTAIAAESSNDDDSSPPLCTIIHVKDQDTTDFEKCMQLTRRVFERSTRSPQNSSSSGETRPAGWKRVVVLGATGGRLDHELSALNALVRSAVDQSSSTTTGRGNDQREEEEESIGDDYIHYIICCKSHTTFALPPDSKSYFKLNTSFESPTCGVIPMCQAQTGLHIKTKGLKWDLDQEFCNSVALGWGGMLSTSNEVNTFPTTTPAAAVVSTNSGSCSDSHESGIVMFDLRVPKASSDGSDRQPLGAKGTPSTSPIGLLFTIERL